MKTPERVEAEDMLVNQLLADTGMPVEDCRAQVSEVTAGETDEQVAARLEKK